jgi:hypothetical protein
MRRNVIRSHLKGPSLTYTRAIIYPKKHIIKKNTLNWLLKEVTIKLGVFYKVCYRGGKGKWSKEVEKDKIMLNG